MKTFLKVSDLVGQALFEFGEQTTHLYEAGLYHALQFVKKANMDKVATEPKTAVLPVDKAKRMVLLPNDYIDYTRVGVLCGDDVEELCNLDKLPMTGRKPSGTQDYDKGFRVNEDKSYILLSSEVSADELLLEYIHSGINPTSDTLIHPYLEQALISYVSWQLIQKRRDYGPNDKRQAMTVYHNEYRKAKAQSSRFTEKELRKALQK
jgi:hypothetical protein